MSDVVEVSYTGDILAHRRCRRSWCYEKHAGFHPYEQVQAMEGRLVHHAMEWLADTFAVKNKRKKHATKKELVAQLQHYFKVLWARGIKTAFSSKAEVVNRVARNLYPKGVMHSTVKAVIEGAVHTEYELRSVRRLNHPLPGGKKTVMLTGILDLVLHQTSTMSYRRKIKWASVKALSGEVTKANIKARKKDLEIWDYKASRADSSFILDYVRQLLAYAALYQERTGERPARCVLFFVNEPDTSKQLICIELTDALLDASVNWTVQQVKLLQNTVAKFQQQPKDVGAGELEFASKPLEERVTVELKKQCTACSYRFDCKEYAAYLGKPDHRDIDIYTVRKN